MEIFVTSGTGEGPTATAAFDAALMTAGVANYNLLYLSSVIPTGSVIRRGRYRSSSEEFGHRLYVVISRHDESQEGRGAWAGIGWTQDPTDARGLFVEIHGSSRGQVEGDIRSTLESMIASRPPSFGPIESEITGIICRGRPVCAITVAVYRSVGWTHEAA